MGGRVRALGGLPRSRVVTALALVVVGLPVLTASLVAVRGDLPRESVLLLYMLSVVGVAVVGGWFPALLAAAVAFALANWFFTPPYNTFVVHERSALLDLVVFLLAAVVVSVAVEVGARHRAAAEHTRLEARLLTRFGSAEMASATTEQVLAQVRSLFDMTSVRLVSGDQDATPGLTLASVGPPPHVDPTLSVPAGGGLVLTAYGPEVFAADRRLLAVLAATAGQAHERERLAAEAAHAQQLAETDRVRTALLTAVSHDLRTPIAGIKAAASGLMAPDARWEPGEQAELLATIDSGADQLADLVDNLLAMSRLQAGVLSVHFSPTALDEVVARALLGTGATDVVVDVPEDLPRAWADAGLLERVVANLMTNARRWSPKPASVALVGTQATRPDGRGLELRVIDHGPGVDQARWAEMFEPFHRLGDTSHGGVGLGLAIARGFTEAMGGTVTPSRTPGGGLTVTVALHGTDHGATTGADVGAGAGATAGAPREEQSGGDP